MTSEHPEIPVGYYCYKPVSIEYGDPTPESTALAKAFGDDDHRSIVRMVTKVCPHWGCDPSQEEQQNGFCRLTGVQDWVSGTLLWDQVKECSINVPGVDLPDDVED
jgi:hypothetical protein